MANPSRGTTIHFIFSIIQFKLSHSDIYSGFQLPLVSQRNPEGKLGMSTGFEQFFFQSLTIYATCALHFWELPDLNLVIRSDI